MEISFMLKKVFEMCILSKVSKLPISGLPYGFGHYGSPSTGSLLTLGENGARLCNVRE